MGQGSTSLLLSPAFLRVSLRLSPPLWLLVASTLPTLLWPFLHTPGQAAALTLCLLLFFCLDSVSIQGPSLTAPCGVLAAYWGPQRSIQDGGGTRRVRRDPRVGRAEVDRDGHVALCALRAGAPRAVHAALLTPPFSISLLARVHRGHGKVQTPRLAGASSSRDQCRCAASHRPPLKPSTTRP